MSATAPAVFITVPKYVAISPSPALAKIRPATNHHNDVEEGAPKGKKRRLDHLTWEEKIQRKKLKNRVAAQTSRDRKKARMEEMEYELKELNDKTEILQNKCESLQAINDSLLAKNQKLDMEVENLRQQLVELQQEQQQQKKEKAAHSATATCAGSGITSNGLTVSTSAATEKEQLLGTSLEDCCPLPTLQDMLLLDEEFDASKLEELAESLLADITADMEAGHRAGDEAAAKDAGQTERLSGSVVGPATERLESGEHSETPASTTQSERLVDDLPHANLALQQDNVKLDAPSAKLQSTHNASENSSETEEPVAPHTVYGTYDALTNSITIVLDDDAVPVNEAVEEIYCDGVAPPLSNDCISCPSPASPSQVFLSVDYNSDDEDAFNFDPIEKFLCPKRPLVSPLARSPSPSLRSTYSDHGYESIMGSPTPTVVSKHFEASIDDFAWNSSFDDLFPTLI